MIQHTDLKIEKTNFIAVILFVTCVLTSRQGMACSIRFDGFCAGATTYMYLDNSCVDIPDTSLPFQWFIDGQPVSGGTHTTLAYQLMPGTHSATLQYTSGLNTYEVTGWTTISETVNTPSISLSTIDPCAPDITLSVTNPQQNISYTWRSVLPGGVIGTGVQISANNLPRSTEVFVVGSSGGSGSCTAQSERVWVEINKTVMSPFVEPLSQYHRAVLYSNERDPSAYWQLNDPNGQNTEHTTVSPYTIYQDGTYYIRIRNGSCWYSPSQPLVVSLNHTPPAANITTSSKAGFTELYLKNTDKAHITTYAEYYLVTDPTSTNIIQSFNDGMDITEEGQYYIRGRDKDTGTWGPVTVVSIQLRDDDSMNWIHTKSFDGNSETVPFAETKSYFDVDGGTLQVQNKIHTANMGDFVFTTAQLRDRFDRIVGASLPAPITAKDFRFTERILVKGNDDVYSYASFDLANTTLNPEPVGQQLKGSAGWYYSQNNNLETSVPTTRYPYTRTEYYSDGSGEVKRSAEVGEMHRMGSGREVLTGTFPVINELDDYLAKRKLALPGITQLSTTGRNFGVQQVIRDQNGRYTITISDKSGKSIMSARSAIDETSVLSVTNQVTASVSVPSAVDYRPLTYFYLLKDQPITIQSTAVGTEFIIEDIISGAAYTPQADGDPAWQAGFYRIILKSGSISFSYKNDYVDVSYQFYDDAGHLRSSVSPNGFSQWLNGTSYPSIDKTTYAYNFKGLLVTSVEPDAGATEFVYRKDGKIRFSQNALQRQRSPKNDTFSYTHYDAFGRPIESGEYRGKVGATQAVTFKSTSMTSIIENTTDEGGLYDGDNIDWVKTHYDEPAGNFAARTGLGQAYSQTFVRNAVSWTENANIETWYSYDELGRVTWMAQRPRMLQQVFVVTYTYDFLGNVLEVGNLAYTVSGELLNQFYHLYEYDANKRLHKAYTSIDRTTKTLRATYTYYLHGPLKRIELGDKLQGVDFVYNIHGWLTQINHPDPQQDPGNDGNDVFGMVLDYYESDMGNLYSAASPQSLHNPNIFHGLPAEHNKQIASHQPLIRFAPDGGAAKSMLPPEMKAFSAENPDYKKMLMQYHQQSSNR